MSVPDYQSLMLPLLRAANKLGGELAIPVVAEEVKVDLSLTDSDMSEMLPSGTQTLIFNRLHWAKTYMQRAELLRSTRRGFFEITDRGIAVVESGIERVDNAYMSQWDEFRTWREKKGTPSTNREESTSQLSETSLTPEDQIALSHAELYDELKTDVIARILESSPVFFEQLIVSLLISMGYGGGRAEMGNALGRTGDGGIDGIVKEDELGLDAVYIQAKRYAAENSVAIREVRDFVGSLEGFQASKGVFVTTSSFPKSAYEFSEKVSKRIVLIDGDRLAELMIRHGVGVRTKDTYEIKRLDEDFFSE